METLTPTARRSIADKWTGAACTLDGEPAKITGRLNSFATVATLAPGGRADDFSWQAVALVMETRGGEFHS